MFARGYCAGVGVWVSCAVAHHEASMLACGGVGQAKLMTQVCRGPVVGCLGDLLLYFGRGEQKQKSAVGQEKGGKKNFEADVQEGGWETGYNDGIGPKVRESRAVSGCNGAEPESRRMIPVDCGGRGPGRVVMGWLKAPSLSVCDRITELEPRMRPTGPDLKETKRDGWWAGRRRRRRDRRRRMIQVRNTVQR